MRCANHRDVRIITACFDRRLCNRLASIHFHGSVPTAVRPCKSANPRPDPEPTDLRYPLSRVSTGGPSCHRGRGALVEIDGMVTGADKTADTVLLAITPTTARVVRDGKTVWSGPIEQAPPPARGR